jgi:hypothetical protein
MADIKFGNITPKNVTDIIEPYLIEWGAMRRVIKRSKYKGWQNKATQIIKANAQTLNSFRKFNLESTKITLFKDDIEKQYNLLSKVIDPVATAKLLHLLCPNFFPIWDNAISDGVRVEIIEKYPEINCARLSSDDYYRYMMGIQEFLVKHDKILNLLAKKYQKGKLRILDECFWWGASRPFCLLF